MRRIKFYSIGQCLLHDRDDIIFASLMNKAYNIIHIRLVLVSCSLNWAMRTTCVWTETFTLNHIRIYYFVFLISIYWTIPNVQSGQWVNTVLFSISCIPIPLEGLIHIWIHIRKIFVIVFPKKVIIQLKAMAFDPSIPSKSNQNQNQHTIIFSNNFYKNDYV